MQFFSSLATSASVVLICHSRWEGSWHVATGPRDSLMAQAMHRHGMPVACDLQHAADHYHLQLNHGVNRLVTGQNLAFI